MAESATQGTDAQLKAHREHFLQALPGRLKALEPGLDGLRARPGSSSNRAALSRRFGALLEAAEALALADVASPLRRAQTALEGMVDERALAAVDAALKPLSTVVEAPDSEPVPVGAWPSASREPELDASPLPAPGARQLVVLISPDATESFLTRSLPAERFAVVIARDAAAALEHVLQEAPPLVIVDTRLSDFEATIKVLSAECGVIGFGDAGVASKAMRAGAYAYAASKLELVTLLDKPTGDPGAGRQLPLEALVQRLSEELQTALLPAGAGSASQLDAATFDAARAVTWAAIARVRELIIDGSGGSVDYQDSGPEGALMLAPRRNSRGGTVATHEELVNRKVLVADDDPAVLWFVGSALRGAGAQVVEVRDGAEAWAQAQAEAPDLVVSDVLMPRLDGFALCRSMKRDVILRSVPVVLLSWKEDLLQRVRELGAGADGYVPKDSEARVILDRCAEALRPKLRLAERLEAGGVVHGRLDGVTPFDILGLVAARGTAAKLEFCDAGFVYEAQIEDGELVAAQRRRADGKVQLGEAVLRGLLGVRAGRFIVREGEAVERNLSGTLAAILSPHIERIRRACRLVRACAHHEIVRLELDSSVVDPYLAASPPVARKLVRKLREGVAMSLLQKTVSAGLLEDVLSDLAIRGGIGAAIDVSGCNLLEAPLASVLPSDAVVETPTPVAPVLVMARSEGSLRVAEDEDRAVHAPKTAAEVQAVPEEAQAVPEEAQAPASAMSREAEARLASGKADEDRLVVSGSDAPKEVQDKSAPSQPAPQSRPEPEAGGKVGPANEWERFEARLESLWGSDRSQPLDLSQAVLAGLSLTPAPKPSASAQQPSRQRVVQAQQTVERAAATGSKAEVQVSAVEPSPAAADDLAIRAVRGLARRLRAGKSRGAQLVQKSKTWLEQRRDLLDDGESSPLPLAAPGRSLDPQRSGEGAHGQSGERAHVEVRQPWEAEERMAVPQFGGEAIGGETVKEAAEQPSIGALELDTDPTDPDWLPPVDVKPDKPSQRYLWRASGLLRRAAPPLAVVTLGGFAAFTAVGAFSGRLPPELTGSEAVGSAVPSMVQPQPVSTETSAAMRLLREASQQDETAPAPVPEGGGQELTSQALELPDGVRLSEGKGLLEVNTGDKHKIYVEGVFVGRGPARRIPVAAGTHVVTTRLEGVERNYQVQVDAAKRTRLQAVQRTAGR